MHASMYLSKAWPYPIRLVPGRCGDRFVQNICSSYPNLQRELDGRYGNRDAFAADCSRNEMLPWVIVVTIFYKNSLRVVVFVLWQSLPILTKEKLIEHHGMAILVDVHFLIRWSNLDFVLNNRCDNLFRKACLWYYQISVNVNNFVFFFFDIVFFKFFPGF